MKVTLEFASDAEARSFIRETDHTGQVFWGYDEYAHVVIAEVDGQPLPPEPECTRVHRSKSKCRKTHPVPDDPRYAIG